MEVCQIPWSLGEYIVILRYSSMILGYNMEQLNHLLANVLDRGVERRYTNMNVHWIVHVLCKCAESAVVGMPRPARHFSVDWLGF